MITTNPWETLERFEKDHGTHYELLDKYIIGKGKEGVAGNKVDKLMKFHDKLCQRVLGYEIAKERVRRGLDL